MWGFEGSQRLQSRTRARFAMQRTNEKGVSSNFWNGGMGWLRGHNPWKAGGPI